LDKLLDLAETETRTLPNWLRREIGVERSPKHFVRYAASIVRDDDFYHLNRHSRTRHIVLRRDYDLATVLIPPLRGATNFNYVVALHIEPPGFSSWHRVPLVGSALKVSVRRCLGE